MESFEYEDSLFSSLLGEGLEKGSALFDAGVDGTPVDKYAVTAEDLLQDLDTLEDPFADWMTEKIDFSLVDQNDLYPQAESTFGSELDELLIPKGEIARLEVGPDDLELLQKLAVDPVIHQSTPLLGENPTLDILTLTPPASVDNMDVPAPGSPNNVVVLPASEMLTSFVQLEQSKEIADVANIVPEGPLTPPLTPKSTLDVESVASPVESKKREAPKRARSKVKSASGSTIVDKKSRKRDQNKMAATRYREKKRAELLTVQGEESQLENKNKELKEQVESLAREIKYMKELMVDIFEAKGISKEQIC